LWIWNVARFAVTLSSISSHVPHHENDYHCITVLPVKDQSK
jgi:hypothetical protein